MLLKAIPHPLLEGSLLSQLDQVERWPSVTYLTAVAVYPMNTHGSGKVVRPKTIVEEYIERTQMAKTQTLESIHETLCMYVSAISMAMNAPVEGSPSRWYAVNVYMMRTMAMAILHTVIGTETYTTNNVFIHDHLQLPPSLPHVLAILSRQTSKTQTTLCLIAAALFAGLPDVDFYAQSPSTRSGNARRLIEIIESVKADNPSKTAHFRHVRGTVANDSVIEFYNSRTRHAVLVKLRTGAGEDLRGVVGCVSFFDEFAFMEDNVIKQEEVIRNTRTNVSILMLTTHGGEHEAGQMAGRILADPVKRFDNGVVFMQSFVCDECNTKPDSSKCEHMIGEMPLWRDIRASMNSIHNAAGNPIELDVARRELLGIASSGMNCAISYSTVQSIFRAPRFVLPHEFRPSPPVLWIALDPSSGVDTSSFSAIFCVRGSEGQFVVLGGENFITTGVESARIMQVIVDCLHMILQTYAHQLRECAVSWFFESNNNVTVAVECKNHIFTYCAEHNVPIDFPSLRGDLVNLARNVTNSSTKDIEGVYVTSVDGKRNGLSIMLRAANSGRFRFASEFASTGTVIFTQVEGSDLRKIRKIDGVYQTYTYEREICGTREFASSRFINILEDQARRLRVTNTGGLSAKGNKKPLLHDDAIIATLIMCDGSAKCGAARDVE